MERQCAPYPTSGSAPRFMRLHAGPDLAPVLHEVLAAETWQARGGHLATATEYLAAKRNAGSGSRRRCATRAPFWSPLPRHRRRVFAAALLTEITDPEECAGWPNAPTSAASTGSAITWTSWRTSPRGVVQRLFRWPHPVRPTAASPPGDGANRKFTASPGRAGKWSAVARAFRITTSPGCRCHPAVTTNTRSPGVKMHHSILRGPSAGARHLHRAAAGIGRQPPARCTFRLRR